MARILTTLAGLSLVLLMVELVIGISIGDLYHQPSNDTLHLATIHRLTGVAAALGVVFVESVIITYFVGTSRWCKEVTDTYKLDPGRVVQANRLKRRAFATALVGMLVVVGIIALGGASDPATGRQSTEAWRIYHFSAALAGSGLILWTFIAGWQYVRQNHTIIQEIVADVARIRRERGLEPAATTG